MLRVLPPTFEEELRCLDRGYDFIIGADEVGRGAFAGPVVTAAVVLPHEFPHITEIHDSKLLTPIKRQVLSEVIQKYALYYEVSEVNLSVINRIGIGKATQISFRQAVGRIYKRLRPKKIFLLIDGFAIPYMKGLGKTRQKAIIKGDRKSISIAAASIIAKVYRDQKMVLLQKKYPNFSFHIHKGYGTKLHQQEIRTYGLSPLHRRSFNLTPFLPSQTPI